MMYAQIRNYKTRKAEEREVRNFDELMVWAAPLINEYQAADFAAGIAVSDDPDWTNNLSFGVTNLGYVVIVNRGEEFNFDQWRLSDRSMAGAGEPCQIRWDEIESLPAEWLVSENRAKQAINYWIDHQKMDPQLEWVSTEL